MWELRMDGSRHAHGRTLRCPAPRKTGSPGRGRAMHFIGIDPGLTAPAICVMDEEGDVSSIGTIRTGNLRGMERVHRIWHSVSLRVEHHPCLVNIEDYAYSRNTRG